MWNLELNYHANIIHLLTGMTLDTNYYRKVGEATHYTCYQPQKSSR